MRSYLVAIALLAAASVASSESVSRGALTFTLPEGFERFELDGQEFFVRRELDDPAYRSLGVLDDPDKQFSEDWFSEGVSAYLIVHEPWRPADEVADPIRSLLNQLTAQWGAHHVICSFPDTGITTFVNRAGAFVAVSMRMYEGRVLLVESIDLVHVMDQEKQATPEDRDEACVLVARAGRFEDAHHVLTSVSHASDD